MSKLGILEKFLSQKVDSQSLPPAELSVVDVMSQQQKAEIAQKIADSFDKGSRGLEDFIKTGEFTILEYFGIPSYSHSPEMWHDLESHPPKMQLGLIIFMILVSIRLELAGIEGMLKVDNPNLSQTGMIVFEIQPGVFLDDRLLLINNEQQEGLVVSYSQLTEWFAHTDKSNDILRQFADKLLEAQQHVDKL